MTAGYRGGDGRPPSATESAVEALVPRWPAGPVVGRRRVGPFTVETVAVLAPPYILGAMAVTTPRLGAVDARRDLLTAAAAPVRGPTLAASLAGIDPSGSVGELAAAKWAVLAP